MEESGGVEPPCLHTQRFPSVTPHRWGTLSEMAGTGALEAHSVRSPPASNGVRRLAGSVPLAESGAVEAHTSRCQPLSRRCRCACPVHSPDRTAHTPVALHGWGRPSGQRLVGAPGVEPGMPEAAGLQPVGRSVVHYSLDLPCPVATGQARGLGNRTPGGGQWQLRSASSPDLGKERRTLT